MQDRALLQYEEIFKTWMQRLGYAETTITGYVRQLVSFLQWLAANHFTYLQEITQNDIETYCKYLHESKTNFFGVHLAADTYKAIST